MAVSKEQALEAILLAMLERLETASPDDGGGVDEDTQEDIEAIAGLADEENLPGLLEDLNA